MQKTLFFVALALCLSSNVFAVEDDQKAAQAAVLAAVKEPGSVKFGAFSKVGDSSACYSIYAKNSLTGMIGPQQAMLKKKEGKWTALYVTDMVGSQEACIDTLKKESGAAAS
jgi:hypothetical protein